MSTTQPGWHPDPMPPTPGEAPRLRYWDGARWTEHTAPAQQPVASGEYGLAQPSAAQYAYGQTTYGQAPYGQTAVATTPDGAPLAGWWQRVLALIVDSFIVGIIAGLIALPWVREVVDLYSHWFDEVLSSAESGSSSIDTTQLQSDLWRPLLIISMINLAVGFAYHVGFLAWKQATPGKLMLGLRVRLRERPGPMPISTILVRWVGQFGVGIFAAVPILSTITSLYPLLNYAWPLWDDKKQAIHDKLAKTNVVRTR